MTQVSYCKHCTRGTPIAWDGLAWYHEDTGLYGCPRDDLAMAEPGGRPRSRRHESK